MYADALLQPAFHGLVGPLDEILTLLPLVIGVGLLVYLYFSARKPKPPSDEAAPADDPADL